MYARILEGRLVVDSTDDAINYFRQSVAPGLRRQPGFVSGRLLSNATSAECLLVLLWESEADRSRADSDSFLQTLLGHLGLYFMDQPTRRAFELSVQIG